MKNKKSGKKKSSRKPLTEMTAQELAEATSEFDIESDDERFGPPPPEAQARWERARRKQAGRPRVGKGAKVISVSVERDLLALSDKLAKKRGITRANLIASGLRALLAADGFAVGSVNSGVEDSDTKR